MAVNEKLILLVEPEEMLRNMLTLYLEGWGYRVITTPRMSEGLAMAKSHAPHLIISGYESREAITGIDLIEQLQADPQTENIPFILFTGHADAVRDKAIIAGVRACVPKGPSLAPLMQNIEHVIGPGRPPTYP